ncbi:hypothetical protein FE782_30500 [Paenibacillus antri]|uniref:Uncharacterized protein n=1 Tax=Paenibacillus antri TaxID=2582848 RepID=A0A5R9G0E2_9BACL|nr:hypothetical protein [Paenibacillus antri]TLS48469.1 hypothetical protein FE782_30500 [Paenibacillus antri]
MKLLLLLFLALSGCMQSPGERGASDPVKPIDERPAAAETKEGEFVYRLVSERSEYESGGEVVLYAELIYTGPEESVTIYHAASPFSFPIRETTRGYEIGYMMNQPLLHTELRRNVPLRETYVKSGGFGEQDEREYVEFMKRFWKEGFPEGEYIVNGSADFFVGNGPDDSDKIDYRIEATVSFAVKGS